MSSVQSRFLQCQHVHQFDTYFSDDLWDDICFQFRDILEDQFFSSYVLLNRDLR